MQNTALAYSHFLRYWRQTCGISQEALSLELDVSRKHLSFLETGRSLPSREMTLKIAETLQLQERDTNNLLIAAGYAPPAMSAPTNDQDDLWRKKAITIMLRGLDPTPCFVRDRYGFITAVNRGWVDYHYRWLGDFIFESPLNIFQLLFHDHGWTRFAQDLGELARQGIAGLEQELLLAPNIQAERLYQTLLASPSFQQLLNAGEQCDPTMNAYTLTFQKENLAPQTNTVVVTTFTEDPVIEPRLLIETWFPRNFSFARTAQELQEDKGLKHPLLYY